VKFIWQRECNIKCLIGTFIFKYFIYEKKKNNGDWQHSRSVVSELI
jgi:hypothetical protein